MLFFTVYNKAVRLGGHSGVSSIEVIRTYSTLSYIERETDLWMKKNC